ncbi:MAG: molybdopterin cofactor-binding domain-containing protein, partial [Candidatus Cloacimonadota bacterium]|nr:molybdopterin cofactor-binding domain-containing protein [Candidatus Cloacimonadota bacterium]
SKAEKFKGVKKIITAKDIIGVNDISHGLDVQPLLPQNFIEYYGQPIALVVAETQDIADKAANLIDVEYEELEPIISIDESIERENYFDAARIIKKGNIEKAFEQAEHIIEDTIYISSAQEQLYLETQRSMAILDDDGGITIYASTQSTTDAQKMTAKVLNLPQNKITVDVKRLGGAFGGKEFQAAIWAAYSGLAAYLSNLPCLLLLDRTNDMITTGKRHPFKVNYKLGFSNDGKIIGLDTYLYANGGAFADLSIAILERALFHTDHAYFLPNAKITGYVCKTNVVPNTAFRGFGGPQGIFPTELAIEKVAKVLGMDSIEIRKKNLYKENQTTPYEMTVKEAVGDKMLEQLKKDSQYENLKKDVNLFNKTHKYKKQGIGIMPGKFGVSFTAGFLNQGSALIWIYADGTISLSHGGIEMGQQVNLKVARVVAHNLGINISRIRVETANTKRVGNASPTAASTGSDINGNAALNASKKIKKRLSKTAAKYLQENYNQNSKIEDIIFKDEEVYDSKLTKNKIPFSELVNYAYMNTVDLGAHGYYYTEGIIFDREIWKGSPFNYFVYGASLSLVEIDTLTGEYQLKKTYIVHDSSKSLNEEIDKGQIYGAFVQGYGYCTMEEMVYDEKGKFKATSTSTYKIPTINDIPQTFEINMLDIERDDSSVLKSKAVGEPPFIYGLSGWLAIYNAIDATNKNNSNINLSFPATPEAVLLAIEELKKEI